MRATTVILCLFLTGCASTGTIRYVEVDRNPYISSDPPTATQIAELRGLLSQPSAFDSDRIDPRRTVMLWWETQVRQNGRLIKASNNSPLGHSISISPAGIKFLLYLPTSTVYAEHVFTDHRDKVSRWDVANLIELLKIGNGKDGNRDLLIGWFEKWEDHSRRIETLDAVARMRIWP